MLIPFVIVDKLIAFHASYLDTKTQPRNIQTHFPGFTPAIPPAFEKDGSIEMKFMDPKPRVFRSMSTPGNKEYMAWLNKVQHKHQEQWKMASIFDVIQISRNTHRINPCMLLSLMYLWEGSTNTFWLPCGMLMPTLLDVAAITGFSPLGETFDPTFLTKNTFSFNRASLQNYIEDHHDQDYAEVSDEEHIVFLTLWLSYYVFCFGSLQIAKIYLSLAIQIHEGRQVCLGKLASLPVPFYRAYDIKIETSPLHFKGFKPVWPHVDAATLVKRHFRVPIGLSCVGAYNAFKPKSTYRRCKTRLTDMSGDP